MKNRVETGAIPRDSWYGSSGTVSGHYMIVRALEDGTYSVNMVPNPELWDWELRDGTWHPLTRCGSIKPVCEIGRQVTCVVPLDALSALGDSPTLEDVAHHAFWLFPVIPRTLYWHPFTLPAVNCPVLPYR
jgi:hypothetical protein